MHPLSAWTAPQPPPCSTSSPTTPTPAAPSSSSPTTTASPMPGPPAPSRSPKEPWYDHPDHPTPLHPGGTRRSDPLEPLDQTHHLVRGVGVHAVHLGTHPPRTALGSPGDHCADHRQRPRPLAGVRPHPIH